MRMMLALALTLAASGAFADEVRDAHKLALQGRDSYWNCLAREYQRPDAGKMSSQAFSADIAGACASERQNFRVTLLGYLSMQFPDAADGEHLATVNRAIELAQKDVITAFVNHRSK